MFSGSCSVTLLTFSVFCTACSRLVWDLLGVILWMAGPRRLQRCGSELSRCFNSQALLGWGCCSNTKWPFFLFSPGVPASVFKILLLLVPSTTFTCAGLQLPERPSMGLLSPLPPAPPGLRRCSDLLNLKYSDPPRIQNVLKHVI